jgi:hypothetical protein
MTMSLAYVSSRPYFLSLFRSILLQLGKKVYYKTCCDYLIYSLIHLMFATFLQRTKRSHGMIDLHHPDWCKYTLCCLYNNKMRLTTHFSECRQSIRWHRLYAYPHVISTWKYTQLFKYTYIIFKVDDSLQSPILTFIM